MFTTQNLDVVTPFLVRSGPAPVAPLLTSDTALEQYLSLSSAYSVSYSIVIYHLLFLPIFWFYALWHVLIHWSGWDVLHSLLCQVINANICGPMALLRLLGGGTTH